jgi:hypothetical protein
MYVYMMRVVQRISMLLCTCGIVCYVCSLYTCTPHATLHVSQHATQRVHTHVTPHACPRMRVECVRSTRMQRVSSAIVTCVLCVYTMRSNVAMRDSQSNETRRGGEGKTCRCGSLEIRGHNNVFVHINTHTFSLKPTIWSRNEHAPHP